MLSAAADSAAVFRSTTVILITDVDQSVYRTRTARWTGLATATSASILVSAFAAGTQSAL